MNENMPQVQTPPPVQEHKVTGEKLVSKVRELIHQGNVRRLIVKNEEGVTLMELPLTVGVMGAVLLPVWVALGAIAALAAHYRIAVELMEIPKEPAMRGKAEPAPFRARPDV